MKPNRTQNDALGILRAPAAFGRQIGFSLLTDKLHGEWIREMVWGRGDMTLQAHRGGYKTTALEVAIAEMLFFLRDRNIIFLRKTDDDVAEVLEAVRKILMHPLTQAMHSALTGKPLELIKSTGKQITTSGYMKSGGTPQLLGIGIGGSLTGKHADIVITDDIVNRLDRESRAERERTKRIYQELQNVKNIGGRIINSGTPWHKEDAFTLMPRPIKFDCYSTGLLSKEQLEDLRMKMAPSLFAANYELKHIASDGALFAFAPAYISQKDAEDCLGKDAPAEALLYDGVAHIDAAYGGSDYTAFTCAQRRGDTIFVYGRLWQRHVDTVLDTALAECRRLRCAPAHVELNADKGYLAKEIRDRNFPAYGYSEKENKYVKISTYLRKWWRNIRFLPGTDPGYVSQIMDFTDTAEHDDAPDSAACVCRILDRR